MLRAVSSFNDEVQALLLDPSKVAPTYPEAMVLKLPRFNAFFDIEDLKPVDGKRSLGRSSEVVQMLPHPIDEAFDPNKIG